MKEFFRPWAELATMIGRIRCIWHTELKEWQLKDEGRVYAHLNGGLAPPDLDLEIARMKKQILEAISSRSSTVVLRTACGATREVELDRPRNEFEVPLLRKMPLRIEDVKPIVHLSKVLRRFKMEGRYDDRGVRIFDEELWD